jgi:amidase
MDTPLHYRSLTDLSDALRRRELSSVEVTAALLDRIAATEPQTLSYVTVMADAAMAQARTADEDIARGDWRGPLHGVPIALKDLCFTRNAPTTAGMTILKDFVPGYDATVVERLNAAGAVTLGKLKMTEGAGGDHHPAIAPPRNPWNPDYWTGASSSGSGVATAAGLCFGSLGSDTGGSIRFPSSACGITGIKPTWGRVSRHGQPSWHLHIGRLPGPCRPDGPQRFRCGGHTGHHRWQRSERSVIADRPGAELSGGP